MNLQQFEEEQLEATRKVVVKDDFKKLEAIAGCYTAFSGKKIVAAIVVCTKDGKIIEEQFAVMESPMPYISGFRFFRESPAIASAFAKLKKTPDVMIVSANGILHPLRVGMASHLGILLKIPTIGVAKSLLCGQAEEEGKIYFNNEIRGQELITREHSKPLYVSAGHRVSLETAVALVKELTKYPHKLPEPLHLAQRLANKMRKGR
ncbi:MAG: endonuclease V [Candidatus Woesearchaeota archaeon]